MKSRVLVVDDDPALAEMLTIVLRGEGFDTAVVGDGTRALPAVRELRPDVVLLDLKMPGADGVAALRGLRGSGNPAKVLVITSFTEPAAVLPAVRAGSWCRSITDARSPSGTSKR